MDVISQKDIPQIVNALVENNKGANNVISAVIGSIKKITDTKATDVKLSDVKHVESLVLSYKNMLNNIISALCVDDNGQARDLHVLLGAMIDPDKSTKDKTVLKYKTVDAALQIPKVIDSMFGIISKVGDTEFSFKTLIKFKLNLWKLRSLMTGLFNDLLNVFSGINPNDEMDKLLKCLVKQPDVITQTNDILQTSEFEKIDNSTTVTQNGQLGILDVFAKTFEIINTLNTLKTPNFAMLEIRMLRIRLALKMVLNNLISWSKKNITKDTKEQLNTIETLLLGEKNIKGQREGGLQSVIQAMVGVMALSKRMKVNIVTLLLVNIALRGLGLIMDTIVKLSTKFEAISDKNIDAAITGAKKIFQMLGDIFKEIVIISLLAIPAIVGALVGAIAILAICAFIWSIKLLEITINKAKLDSDALSSISDIITSLKQTMIDVLLIGLLAVPAVVAMVVVTLFVGVLALFVMLLNSILKTVASFIDNAKNNLRKLRGVILQLFIIGMMMIGLALIAETVVRESLWILAFLGVVIVLASLIVLIGLGIAKLSAFVASGLAGFAMIVLAIGMLFAIALMMKAIEMIKLDSDKIKETVKDIVSTCTAVVKLILFGDTDTPERSDESWIVTLLKGIGGGIAQMIGAFIAVKFLAQTVSAIFFVLILAVQLRLIQMIDLDVDKIKENVRAVVKTCKELVITLLFGDSFDSAPEKGNESNWILNLLKNVGSTFIGILGALVAVRFLAMSLASVTLILILAKALSSLQEINLDTDKIKDVIARVIDCSYTVIFALIMQPETSTDGNKKSWLEKILTFVGGQLISYLPAMLAIRFLATTVGMVLLMKMLASLLSTICKFELNTETIRYKVADIIDAAYTVIFALILPPDRKDEPNKKSWVEKILTFVGGQFVSFIPAILAIRFLATTVGMVLLMKMLASMLIDIIKFDFDPNEVKKKVDDIVSGATSVMDALLNRNSTETTDGEGNKESGGFLEWIGDKVKNLGMNIFGGITDYIGILTSMPWLMSAMTGIGIVSFLASGLKRIMEMPNLSGINKKVNSIVSGATSVIDLINNHDFGSIDDDKLEILEQITDIIEDFTDVNGENADGVVKVVNSYANFIDKVNTVDVTKLETSTKMFEQMARFSESIEGDFDELAETLSDKLLPVLTELKEVMSVLPEKIDVGFQNTSASIAATGTAPTRENYEAQLKRENPNLSQADVDAIVTARLNEKATTEANGITAKLDELMTLLKGFSGDRVIVQTV
jgi:hypothetical protein